VIAPDAAVKLFGVDQVGELGENDFSSVHPGSLAKGLLGENRLKLSNRSQPLSHSKTRSTLSQTAVRSFNTRTVVRNYDHQDSEASVIVDVKTSNDV